MIAMHLRIAIILYPAILMALISEVAPGYIADQRAQISHNGDNHKSRVTYLDSRAHIDSLIELIKVPVLNIINFESIGEDATNLRNILQDNTTMIKIEAEFELHYPPSTIKDKSVGQKKNTDFTTLMVSNPTKESLTTLMVGFSRLCQDRNSSTIAIESMDSYSLLATVLSDIHQNNNGASNMDNVVGTTDCAYCVRCLPRGNEFHDASKANDEPKCSFRSFEPKLMLNCQPLVTYDQLYDKSIIVKYIWLFMALTLVVMAINYCIHTSHSKTLDFDLALHLELPQLDPYSDSVDNSIDIRLRQA